MQVSERTHASNHVVQFHTGLGDPTLVLTKASPAHLQPVIDAFPTTKFVLLHASYPYTRDAGYLAAMYKNVWLDLGEVWPFVSGEGQKALVSQAFELCPTNKIIWSSMCIDHVSKSCVDPDMT